ncbi:bifunctional phosphoglucose/phosphomannose isomerase [Candidatus Nanosynbacter sp. TM7-074]|uniref:Bifunctional phosphoglucose/phosphomannose isomerase n=1 Tax=Candidatus Nanosynbacter sp. TM7-074 TaxID=3158573 RepID=A0AB39J3V2_9BACT
MLDDINVIKQYDPGDVLSGVLNIPEQARYEVVIYEGSNQRRDFKNIVIAGMGGSALAADMVRVLTAGWLHLPLEVVKGYDLPGFVGEETLVIAVSHSGNTEETLSCYQQALDKKACLAVMSTGGELIKRANNDNITYAQIPAGTQPRMSTVYHLRGLLKLLQHFWVIDGDLYNQVADSADWLEGEISHWAPAVPEKNNLAKQIAKMTIGKTLVIFGGELTWPLAYKWKISWNESAKNLAFSNQYPEFNHNEFIGWSSHPVEKPFTVFDIRSNLERDRIRERMELSDRLLSGKRPKAHVLELQGRTLMQQLLWGLVLADAASIYTAILNGVNPGPVHLIEKLKAELS